MDEHGKKLERIKALKNGHGVQHLLDAAYKILGNPIVMFNTEYCLQAYTTVITDDPIWNELVINGNFSYETRVVFKEEGFIDASANSKTIAFMTSDKLKYDRIAGKLYNEDNVNVSNLVIVSCDRPFEDGDAEAFEAFCAVVSKEIIKSAMFQTYGKLYQENYIRKLLDGQIEDRELYASHIAIVYYDFCSNMRLVVADPGEELSKLAHYRDLFGSVQTGFVCAIYSKYILVLIDSEHDNFVPKRDLKKLYPLFVQNNIKAGVSGCFDNLYELRKEYAEAVAALEAGLAEGKEGQFFL